MAEPKPLASLSAGLLARKGAARPAMRRQTALPGMNGHAAHGHDDLGWNDMGYDVDPLPLAADPVRNGSHGLSPMSVHGAHDDSEDRIVRDALSAAVDRAIDSPVAVPAVRFEPGRVEPIQPDGVVPTVNDELVVHRHQQRLAAEIAPEAVRRPSPPPAVEPAAEPVAGPTAGPVAAATVPARRVVAETAAEEAPVVVARPRAARTPAPRATAGTRGAFAFTLRLDPERHLRLRLASATSNRSAQQILIGLIDDYLASQPEIAAFAANLAPKSAKH